MPIIQNDYSVREESSTVFHYLAVPQNKELFYYSTSAGRELWKRDYSLERKDINNYMINYLLRGRATLSVNGRELPLRQGDLTFLHLGGHSTLSCCEEGTEVIFFHVLGAQTQDIYNAFREKGGCILHNIPEDLMNKTFQSFAALVGAADGFYGQSRILYGLLTEILRLRDLESQPEYPKFIDKILCHILYSCPPPTPAEVAAHFGFSPIYLERLFKRYVGESMRSYILRQKYAFACRFLADTDMTVDEVARRVGYSDAKGLIVLFAKFGKLTPLAYRKKVRGKP